MANPEAQGPGHSSLQVGAGPANKTNSYRPNFSKHMNYSEYSYYASIILTTIIVIPNTILNIIVKHMPKVASSSPQKHWI